MKNGFKYKIVRKPEDKKRYRLQDIGYALKVSPDAVGGYFSNKHISVKGGLTIDQIEEAILHGNLGGHGGIINDKEAAEILLRLKDEKGIYINEEIEEQMQMETSKAGANGTETEAV